MPLDVSKLENVQKLSGGKIRAACPACRLNGGDPQGNHLLVFASGAYGCAANQMDSTHTKEIYRLIGIKQEEIVPDEQPALGIDDYEIECFFEEKSLSRLMPIYDYWESKRGISTETIRAFRGGLSSKDKMNGRFCFPIYSPAGRIHGIMGRWVLEKSNDRPWKKLGKSSTWVYPLYFNRDYILACRKVILVESIGDMLSLWDAGIKIALVLFGATISPILISALVGLNPIEINISTNNDVKHTVGQNAAKSIKSKLDKFFDDNVVRIRLPQAKDWGETPKDIIKEYWKDVLC